MFIIQFVIELLIKFIVCLKCKQMQSNAYRPSMYYSGEIKKLKQNSKKYHELLKQFLQNFKVYRCTEQLKHNLQNCFYFHDQNDRRRNPFLIHDFLYSMFEKCDCNLPQCPLMHNQFQSAYHPLMYKTNHCQKQQNCEYGLYCCYLHLEDLMHFQYGQSFRFDLRTFKTEKCFKKSPHQRKTCLYYHNDRDKRRPSNIEYSHFYCTQQKCNNQNCQFSHNKLEQLYHPNRYKTKFCQFFPNNIEKCDYKSFCSFAHTQNQITQNIQLIHLLQKNNDFYINLYKTVWCPFTQNHERDKCVYAHNIQDFRRNPIDHPYQPTRCEFWNFSDEIKSIEEAGCKQGMDCKKCHGWMEQRYHPSNYNVKKSKSLKKEDIEAAQNIVSKKLPELSLLSGQYKPKGKGNTNPQILKSNYSKGTPFFKNDKNSEYSQKTKAKSNNLQSDKSIDGSQNKDPVKMNDVKIAPPILSNIFAFVDNGQNQVIWDSQHERKGMEQTKSPKEQNSARSKSARKSSQYEATYSNSIKNALPQDHQILKKLRKQRFNQIQIVNLDRSKIDKLSFLSPQQKNRLDMGLKLYSLKQLTRYFIQKKKQGILQKMQQKKVKQAILLKLIQKQINQLSFLEVQQKAALPKLLKQYSNQKQFKQLNKCIQEQTKMK